MELQEAYTIVNRTKFRFDSPQGRLFAEDLWDLPLTTTKQGRASLDLIAVDLDDKVTASRQSKSFVNTTTSENNSQLRAAFTIVLDVIKVKQAEALANQTAKATQEKKQRIAEIIAQKQDNDLANKSLEELQTLLQTL